MSDGLDTAEARKEFLDRVQRALGNEDTRYFLRWVLDRSGVLQASFSLDPNETAFVEGGRALGLEIVGVLNEIDPYEFVRLMKEAADEVVRARNKMRDVTDAD